MTKDWKEAFDNKFGKDGPEANSDSIGRMAGCDDCGMSIELRAEHKAFIEQLLAAQRKEIAESVKKEICMIAQVDDWEAGITTMERRLRSHPDGGFGWSGEQQGLGMVTALSRQVRRLLSEPTPN